MQRPEYRDVFAISQSAIKAFKTKPLSVFKRMYIDKEDMGVSNSRTDLGSLVDTIAFQPELLEKRFYIPESDVPLPTEVVKEILDKTFVEAKEFVENRRQLNDHGNLPEPVYVPFLADVYEFEKTLLKNARDAKFGGEWSSERILKAIYKTGADYFRFLDKCDGRIIVSNQDNTDAIEMKRVLETDKDTSPFFVKQEGEELLFQQEIFIEHKIKEGLVIPLKGALDILKFNHKEKWVQIPDLKTTYSAEHFKSIAKDWDYVFQVSFYMYLVKEWLKTYKKGRYVNYKMLNPINIVIDRVYKIPLVYEYSAEDIEIAQFGSPENNVNGWMNDLNEIAWHIENDVWSKPREAYETGKIKLKIFK